MASAGKPDATLAPLDSNPLSLFENLVGTGRHLIQQVSSGKVQLRK
jgi:hypothetical protein